MKRAGRNLSWRQCEQRAVCKIAEKSAGRRKNLSLNKRLRFRLGDQQRTGPLFHLPRYERLELT